MNIAAQIGEPDRSVAEVMDVIEQANGRDLEAARAANKPAAFMDRLALDPGRIDAMAVSLEDKDYTTHNFLQWYVSEQLEEESLAKLVLDKLKLIGNDKGGLYLFDNDIEKMSVPSPDQNNQ